MKRTRKLILALVVVMSLLMAMAVAIIPAGAAETRDIYFVNAWHSDNRNWDSVSVYTFSSGNQALDGAWPGKAMTQIGTNDYGQPIWKASIDANAYGIVFKGNGQQTVDIKGDSNLKYNGFYLSGWDGNQNKAKVTAYCHTHVGGTAATCTTAQTCVACGTTVKAALGHDFSNGSTCANGCGTTCKHESYTEKVVNPTCTDGGYTRHTCQSCGYFYDTDLVDANGHSFVDGKCSVCGIVRVYYSGTLTNVHAYIWNSEGNIAGWPGAAIPETNKVNGVYYVDVPGEYDNIIFNNGNGGGDNQTDDLKVPTDANVIFNGSEWVAHIGGTATCTEQAECTVCGEKYGEALGHEAGAAADCENAQTCIRCDYVYAEALGHAWVDADCYTPKTCDTCGATEGGPVHATVTHVAYKAATCTENGNIEYWYCEACGQAWLDEECRFNTNLLAVVLPMTNHLENCTHKVLVGNKGYATIQEAIAGAAADSEIVLNSDVTVEGDLPIEKKVTINLNGKTLTAGAVVTFFEGTQFIGEGKLVVAKNSLYNIEGETKYVPVWNEAGYYTFSEVKDQIKESTVEDTEVVVFRPAFENTEIKNEFADGAADNGISFVINITWGTGDNAVSKQYTLSEELIAEIYSQKKAIQLGFENWQVDVEYTVTLRIVSGGLYYETKLCTMLNGDVAPNVPTSVTE